jgi:hypothetical protein
MLHSFNHPDTEMPGFTGDPQGIGILQRRLRRASIIAVGVILDARRSGSEFGKMKFLLLRPDDVCNNRHIGESFYLMMAKPDQLKLSCPFVVIDVISCGY